MLVHAKLYMAEWECGTKTIKRLAWGSPNASRNGFETNAEAISFATIEDVQENTLLPYFRRPWQQDSGKVEMINTVFPGGVRLLLPEFCFRSDPAAESFEAWIQAGRLCHKYEPDQTFARLSVKLRNPLPLDKIREIFKDAGLRADTDGDVLRFAYLGQVAKGEGKKSPRWRERFFVETWLGFWTSDDSYRTCQDSFIAQNGNQRKNVLSKVKLADEVQHGRWYDEFIKRLSQAISGLKEEHQKAGNYFELKKRDLDLDHYRDKAGEQLRDHQRKAHNKIFEERFTKGYVFPPLPRFRGEEAVEGGSFQDFVHSWCESILNGMAKRKCRNLVVKAIREEFCRQRVDAKPTSGEELRAIIEAHWRQIGMNVKKFYEESQP